MSAPTLGKRWVCFECNAPFFDLCKPSTICRKCSTDQAKISKRVSYAKVNVAGAIERRQNEIDAMTNDFDLDSASPDIESFEQLEEKAEASFEEEEEY